jgi:hypothetical protein
MHLFDVTLSTLQRRNRAAFVRVDDEVTLWPGEKVMLRDQDGEYFAGTVVGPVEQPEPRYHVHVGVRMPEEYAQLRLQRDRHLDDLMAGMLDGDIDHEAEDAVDDEIEVCGPAMVGDVQQLLDLLGEARETMALQSARQRVREDIARDVQDAGAVVVPHMPPQRLA